MKSETENNKENQETGLDTKLDKRELGSIYALHWNNWF